MFYYKIAGITIRVDGDWPLIGQGRLRAYEIKDLPESGDGCEYDVHYHIQQECDVIAMPDAAQTVEVNQRLWMNLKNGNKAMVDRILAFSDRILNCIEATADWSDIHAQLCREDFSGLDKNMRAFNVIGETLPYALLKRNGFVVHSSCISYRGQAVLFSAPSGTGKSTHTRLWKEFYPETLIINDDLPAVRMMPNAEGRLVPFAFGTPWSGKTQTNLNANAPICAIVFLKQAPQNAIRRISGGEAVYLLMQGIRKPVLEDLMQDSLEMASKLLSAVPAYELSCTISREAVETVRKTVFPDEKLND